MMYAFLGIVESSIFLILSGIHFYWVFGGKWGLEGALPTNESGAKVLNPGKIDTAVVGFGLLMFGMYYLLKVGMISLKLPGWIVSYSGWLILIIFFVRAIGDFKYVGLFKKIRNTDFSKRDSKYYTPLCLLISFVSIILELIESI